MHRDLKPDNILLDKKGRPFICDFGYAKKISGLLQSQSLGTPLYMGPEQIYGHPKYDLPADVYSYGHFFRAVLAGQEWRPPVDSLKDFQMMVTDGDRPDIVNATEKQTELIERMWHGNPDRRPMMSQVVHFLEDPEYWVPGVVAKKFQKYKSFLDAGDSGAVLSGQDLRRSCLERSCGPDFVAKVLGTLDASSSFVDRLICVVGFVLGTPGAEFDTDVMQSIRDCLDHSDHLVPSYFTSLAQRQLDDLPIAGVDGAPEQQAQQEEEMNEAAEIEYRFRPVHPANRRNTGPRYIVMSYGASATIADVYESIRVSMKWNVRAIVTAHGIELDENSQERFSCFNLGDEFMDVILQ
jgi:serine/threonine protein kinase